MTFNREWWPTLSGFMIRSLAPAVSVAVLAIGVAAGVQFMYGDPTASRVAEAETAYEAAKDARTKLQHNRQIQARARAALQERDLIWNTLPTQQDFSDLALDLSELGRTEGVLIPGMTYTLKLAKDQTVATEATLSFQATGPYASIYRFIHRLEHHTTYMVIDKLDVRRLEKSEKSPTNLVSFSVTLTTFLKPTPANSGA